jgi:hypothetical protein
MIASRLAANQKLSRQLNAGLSLVWSLEGSGVTLPTLAIPFDSKKLSQLFQYIARGLCAHHWGAQVPRDYFVGAGLLSQVGEAIVAPILAKNGRGRVVESLGGGVFRYEGVQAVDNAALSVWCFYLFGGATFAGDPDVPEEASARLWAMTSPRPISDLFDDS